MNLKGLALKVCINYVLPYLAKIGKSFISNVGKSMYERLYKRFTHALERLEEAINKIFETEEPKKLKKRITCCKLGLKFFEKIKDVLDDVLCDYSAAIEDAENKYENITGERLVFGGDND